MDSVQALSALILAEDEHFSPDHRNISSVVLPGILLQLVLGVEK